MNHSATIQGYLLTCDQAFEVAKSNGSAITLVEPAELPAGATGYLRVEVDGVADEMPLVVERCEGRTVWYRSP